MGISGNWEKRRVEPVAYWGEIDRRTFIKLSGASVAALIFGLGPYTEKVVAQPRFSDYLFSLGVASGDPLPDGVVLWTRLAPDPLAEGGSGGMPRESVTVRWQVAADERFRNIVREGTELARPELAHSVHAEVEGLEPGREYYYRFQAGTETSPVGRTKTAPARDVPLDWLTFAFASCQLWQDGYYSAYRRMAEEDLDLVVHLGDYIYEYGVDPNGGARNVPVPGHLRNETKTLDRYRLQHALYRTDEDLQAAHAAFPWVVIWDDHEVENDYTDDVPQSPPAASASWTGGRLPTRPTTSTCRCAGPPCPRDRTCPSTGASPTATWRSSTSSIRASTAAISRAATARRPAAPPRSTPR